jgi:sialic acid synthase SpsE
MQIILDISANSHRNDESYYRKMIDAIAAADNRKHVLHIKGQLFHRAGANIPQDFALFERMANWTFENYGYKTTASVFDKISLELLLLMDIPYNLPFIKIANRRDLDWLIGEIPRKIPVYKSIGSLQEFDNKVVNLACVSKYPATIDDYLKTWATNYAVSDHTIGLELVKLYQPKIYECHFCLEDSTGLDAGPWAKRPKELKEVLEL